MKEKASSTHVLLFPFPSTGHIVPLLDLTHRLVSSGLNATVLVTPPNLPLLQPLLSAHPPSSLQTLVLNPPDPPTRRLPAKIIALSSLSDQIISWFKSHPSPPVAIISDFFLGWTHNLARHLHVPHIVFCPSGALGTSVYYSLWKDQPKNPVPGDPDSLIRFDGIPGQPVFPWRQLSPLYTSAQEGDTEAEAAEFFGDSMLANLVSWGTIINTLSELESVYVDHLKKEMGHGRVWSVGPLLPDQSESEFSNMRSGPISVPAEEVLTWLDKRPESSVVYVCFGSRYKLSEEQAAALETALGRCKANFIWCAGRSDSEGLSFQGDKGMVIRGWAPQLDILRHRAVGAFVTHCGWNSVLEAVDAGVVMVAWPMGADQFADANLIVEELGLAIRVPCAESGSRNLPDPDELARVLDEAVDVTCPNRERVTRMRSLAGNSLKPNGSSHRNLADLVTSLTQLKQ